MRGCKPVDELTEDRDDGALEVVHVRSSALAEVGSLLVPPADESVAVLDESLYPQGVGTRVVDVASDGGLDLLRVQELASVVGGDRAPY